MDHPINKELFENKKIKIKWMYSKPNDHGLGCSLKMFYLKNFNTKKR